MVTAPFLLYGHGLSFPSGLQFPGCKLQHLLFMASLCGLFFSWLILSGSFIIGIVSRLPVFWKGRGKLGAGTPPWCIL